MAGARLAWLAGQIGDKGRWARWEWAGLVLWEPLPRPTIGCVVPATGGDGQDGQDGQDGVDAVQCRACQVA